MSILAFTALLTTPVDESQIIVHNQRTKPGIMKYLHLSHEIGMSTIVVTKLRWLKELH